jgi:rhodanese-related sulfurtransferase
MKSVPIGHCLRRGHSLENVRLSAGVGTMIAGARRIGLTPTQEILMHQSTRLTAILTISALLLGAGCATKTSDRSLKVVTVGEALKESSGKRGLLGMSGGAASIWIDPRPRAAYDAEHIPGAINMPFPEVERLHKKLSDYDVIVVYDADYGDVLASAMSKKLIELGHRDVLTLKGGLRAWKDDGNDVEPVKTP